MPNVRDHLSLYVLSAVAAIVCIASIGQVVSTSASDVVVARTVNTTADQRAQNLARLHESQVRDAT